VKKEVQLERKQLTNFQNNIILENSGDNSLNNYVENMSNKNMTLYKEQGEKNIFQINKMPSIENILQSLSKLPSFQSIEDHQIHK
jgi:hypothetical protein